MFSCNMGKVYDPSPWRWPVNEDVLEAFSFHKSPYHTGKLEHCVDFFVPFRTPVLAMAGGVVGEIKQDSKEWEILIIFLIKETGWRYIMGKEKYSLKKLMKKDYAIYIQNMNT